MIDLKEYLQGNEYPGRGILFGKTQNGLPVFAYFIMGRSENSRNRVFVQEGKDLRTKAYDESKVEDPSLIIYYPVRVTEDGRQIVTNGDQTDTIYHAIAGGKCFNRALKTRTFEPDGPNYTPRISGMMQPGEQLNYVMNIIKSADGDPESTIRHLYRYENVKAGVGHFLHTYQGNGNPLPSFKGEPRTVALPQDAQALATLLWENLNAENKISLFVRQLNADGSTTDILYNAREDENHG